MCTLQNTVLISLQNYNALCKSMEIVGDTHLAFAVVEECRCRLMFARLLQFIMDAAI